MGKKSKVVILLLLTVVIIYAIAFVLLIRPLLDEAASKINPPTQNVVPVVVSKTPETVIKNETLPAINVSDVVDSVLSSKDLSDGLGQEIVNTVQNQLPSLVEESVNKIVENKLPNMVEESVNIAVERKLSSLVDESVNKAIEKKVPLIITNVSDIILNDMKAIIPEEVDKSWDSYIDALLQDERFKLMVKDEVTQYETGIISKTVAEESGTSIEYVDTLIKESIKDEFTSQKNEIVDRVIDQIKKEGLGKVETPTEVAAAKNTNEVVTMENGETFELETKPYMDNLNYLSAEEYEKKRKELLNNTVNDILSNLKD
ncbi:MAG: hypothetical protein WC162_04960 [Sphaerochaetaceae bacterium]|nr:hypothetical protein [Sphaerochaetaceae bacterium]